MKLRLSMVFAAILVGGLAASVMAPWEPVAVAALGPDRFAVLDKSGQIELVAGRARKILTQVQGFSAVDLSGVERGAGNYTMLVASVRRNASGDVIGALDVMPSGPSLRTSGTIYAGVAFKPGSSAMGFASNARAREIYLLGFAEKTIVAKHLASVPDSNAILGAVCLDASGQRLFVADVTGGNIWSVAATGGEPALLATGLRDLRALAADDKWVFAADGDGRRIVQFAQSPAPNAPRQTALSARSVSPAEFKSPSAVAVAGAGQLAVGDSAAHALFLVDLASGKVVATIR